MRTQSFDAYYHIIMMSYFRMQVDNLNVVCYMVLCRLTFSSFCVDQDRVWYFLHRGVLRVGQGDQPESFGSDVILCELRVW